MVELEPKTVQNRTITALELRSDSQTKKPGILIVGGKLIIMSLFSCQTHNVLFYIFSILAARMIGTLG